MLEFFRPNSALILLIWAEKRVWARLPCLSFSPKFCTNTADNGGQFRPKSLFCLAGYKCTVFAQNIGSFVVTYPALTRHLTGRIRQM